ncbi:nucleoside triphosphate pyrophosphohydrolase [Candidatus Solirubrobacter pratensis]|uniref:nucleoside triphosphate pyrophosphohydrolase n=1 Tax=Candidatus Solirubrobacter pratensis TaxID=1298857 RepID=UPI0004275BC7|nr:nucleoside triphosphate pyrophosphohydrolase [Candidatus Solirubrobacter pratensis]
MRKLVRDRIPLIIAQREGSFPTTYRAAGTEYEQLLRDKLQEEVTEYLEEGNVEELADIFEVLLALAALDNYVQEDLLLVADGKRVARGGFFQGIVLQQSAAVRPTT